MGDRACLAFGIAQKSIVVTADRAWDHLTLGVDIEIIRGIAAELPDKDTPSKKA